MRSIGRNFDSALLDCFEIDAGELPALAEADSCAGPLSSQGADLTGLPAGIPVAVGTGDDFSTPLGGGLLAPGRLAVVLGTGEVVGTVHPRLAHRRLRPSRDPRLSRWRLFPGEPGLAVGRRGRLAVRSGGHR